MFSSSKFNSFFALALILPIFFLYNCGIEKDEYGKKSDYQKLGYTCPVVTDITPPTISSESPKDNSTYKSVATTASVTFSEAVATSSITTNTSDTTCSGSFQLSSDNFSTCIKMSAAPVASDDNKTFTVTPASSLSADTTFKRKITTSVADTSCNFLGSDNSSIVGFSTAPSGSGTITGSVQDYDGDALSGVSVSFTLYGSSAGDNATSVDNGSFSQSPLGLGVHTLTYSKSNYLDAVLTDTLEEDGQTLNVETVRLLPESCTSGTMSGRITDAVTGDNMSGVGMWYASGMNKDYYIHTDEFTYFADTDANGAWSLNKSAGWYTINSWKSGYYDGYVNVFACGDQPNQDNTLTTKLDPGWMRIVLTWPKTSPVDDFDSHLFIPYTNCVLGADNDSGPNGKCHLWFKTSSGGDGSTIDYSGEATADYHVYDDDINDFVTLDEDGRLAPGFETITISKVRSGVYSYSVKNFEDKSKDIDDSESTNLRKSRAKVKLRYNDGSKVHRKKFHVPNDNGTLWRVFTFDKDASGPFTRVKEMTIGVDREDIY